LARSASACAVRKLLQAAPAVHADETPARAAGGLRYVHLACTAYLTLMHTGDRSADAIDAGAVLPGYTGIIVRDGYHAGYGHLTNALHAWCAAHLLRDLKDLYDFEPGHQDWASHMATLLIEARDAAAAARQAGQDALAADVLQDLVTRYRDLAASGLAANLYRRTDTAKDARRIARRFLNFEDMILRFATRPDLDIFTNNEAERPSGRSRYNSAAQEAAGSLCKDSPTSPASSPTCPQPPSGASANSTPSAASSTGTPGCPRPSNPPN